jgi:hypothetical protein
MARKRGFFGKRKGLDWGDIQEGMGSFLNMSGQISTSIGDALKNFNKTNRIGQSVENIGKSISNIGDAVLKKGKDK